MKKIYILISILIGLTLQNCDFLDEESYGPTVDVFKTEEGSEALVNLLYKKINVYGGTYSLADISENGADTWLRAKYTRASLLVDYNGLTPSENSITWLWEHFYKAVWNTNLFLESYSTMKYEDEDVKKMRKAEVLTLQSLYLFWITNTWGDVYLPKSTDMNEGLYATRSSVEDFYQKMISNLKEAIPDLPPTTNEQGRVNQAVAKALLARIYLYHGDWKEAAEMADDVITNYGYELEPSWKDLWDESKKINKEFIWTVEFTRDKAFGGGGSWYWQAFCMDFDRFPGIKPELNYTGYGIGTDICQFLPTKYYISLFDKKADLRWEQGHQCVYLYNDASENVSGTFPDMKTIHKDTALLLYPDKLTSAERNYAKTRFTVFDIDDLYDAATGVPKDRGTFISLTKFFDNTRTSATDNISSRNYPVLRLAEMYLIAAEANIMQSKKDVALPYITDLRKRAIAPGYENAMKVTSDDMTLDFILEERGRELGGEHQRWFDLKRTGKLLEHVRAYNPDAGPYIKEFHLKRPIPQKQLDGMPDPSTLGQNDQY
ncbi:MAG: RagB/SusD family nutrient uptake outer membrane protein [Dysgonomonas sp.]|nr:RagB/SusD family nutrient uptake outer membrane protein [Dysgonomonas sp.]